MLRRFSPTSVGRWSSRHPWVALAIWLAFVVAAAGSLAVTGSKKLDSGAVGESARGWALMAEHQLGFTPREYAYVHSDSRTIADPGYRATVAQISARMRATFSSAPLVEVSPDRHSVLVAAELGRPADIGVLWRSIRAIASSHPGMSAIPIDNGAGAGNDLQRAEKLSVPVTLIVLLIAFGALVAALVPVVLAVTAVVAAFGLLGPISQAFPLDDSVKTVVLLIGMAVGVDYALFYVVRSREERLQGCSSHEALERTARTSGRSVVVAGTTVAIAMAGQFAIGSDIFNGIASGTIVVVACAVAGSVTVLPALLQLLGPRIDRGRIPFLPSLRPDGQSRLWSAVIGRVLRRPAVAASASAALLVALAIPAFSLHVAKPSSFALSSAGQSSLAAQVTAEFPSLSPPAVLVAAWPPGREAAVRAALHRLESLAAASGIAHRPFQLSLGADGHSVALALPLTGLGDNPASRDAIGQLRDRLIPQTLGRVAGVQTAITGDTAQDVDFTHQMTTGAPYVQAFELVLAFLLLLVTFRSLVVPLKAILLNLLAVGASYGVLVLVFQHTWAQSLLGFHSDGAIISWLPLFLFVVLFGLSMDYHVFILSRVREGVDRGMSTDEALRYGITRTAGVVTSAALVMVGVFSLFGTSSSLDLKEAGVGLAVAVALDATVIRGVLLPASMKLLGERNWYLPEWLRWLPAQERLRPRPALAPAAD